MAEASDKTGLLTDDAVVEAARAKLRELSLCDLRHVMPRYAKVIAGGPITGGLDSHEGTRAHLRQILTDIANSSPK